MRPVSLLSVAMATALSPLLAQDPNLLAQRAAIAAAISGQPVVSVDTPTNAEIEAALDLPSGVTTAIATTGAATQITAPATMGIISPRAGSGFLLLSSGIAGTAAPEPGTGFGAFGGAFGNDTASVSLTITVPTTATTLSFDYRFFSAEYPDFVLAGFNDTFSARRDGSTFASISVDSASFFPAFTSIAAGTGFDIFAPNPAGVTTSFPGGLPDAGLTDWLSATTAVTPGSTITLVFGIGDFGDDILDSAVLVDNVRFSSLEVLDGDDNTFRAGGNDVTNNPNVLAVGGNARIGICADGTSRLVLRMNLPGPGTVQFAIQGFVNAAESGALGAPGAAPAGATINVNSVNTPQGHKAFAVYHAPLDFVRAGVPGDANARSRNLTLTTVFTPQAGAVQNGTRDLVIERPPVVLCHGLWSNPATWNGFAPLIGSALFDFTRADYSNNNAGRFAVNRFQTRSNATAARQAKNRRGIASAQVDWIGHSMGGLLPRSFAATGFFRRPDNFNRGDLHKLITVNTPHWGSPMANLLLGIRGTFFVGDLLIVGMERMNMSVVGGAIDDLAEGSAALGAIGATPVRSHSICGIGGSQAIGVADIGFGVAAALSPPPWNGLFRLLRMVSFATTASVYRFNEHDFIVLLPSQQGGLGGATTTTLGGLGSHHTAVTSFAPAANQCITLLNAPTTGATFAAVIPAPNLTPPDPGDGGSPTPAPAGMGINFTTAPSTVNPGANVTLSVSAFGGYAPTTVLFVGSLQSFAVDETPPFSVAITVPPESIGEFSVMAIAIDALDRVATTPPLAFPVQVTATLTGLTSFVDRLYLTAPGQESSVTIYGTYSDGVPRIVSAAGLGTTFLSSDPMVATVSPLGEVTAVGEGTCAVIAQHGGLEVSFGVFVSWQADLTLVGEGCATSVGVPVLGSSGGAPVLGNANFALTAGNAPVPSFVLFALQVGPAVTPGVPVPGAPPCARAHLLPHDLIATIASPTGSASHPLAIPASSALAGTVLTAQLAVWDPALVGFGLPIGTSPALQVTIGR